MIHGRARAHLFNAEGIGDEPFLEAMRQKRLMAFLKTLDRKLFLKTNNLLMDMWSAKIFQDVWYGQGVPNLPAYWYYAGGTRGMCCVYLSTQSAEPTLTEPTSGTVYGNFAATGDACDTTHSAKRFFEDDAEQHQIYVNPDGRESIIWLNRFLWLPSQGNLSTIRSLTIQWCDDADSITTSLQRGKVGRVRFKDGGGNPVTFDKTSIQALLVEYEQEWISA